MNIDERATIDEHEWVMQESARAEDRSGAAPDGARMARYRFVAHCLRQAPEPALPADFARTCAQRIEAEARRARTSGMRFERRLVATSVLLYGSAMLAATLVFGMEWPSLPAMLGAGMRGPWLLALLACLGASGGFGQWRRRNA